MAVGVVHLFWISRNTPQQEQMESSELESDFNLVCFHSKQCQVRFYSLVRSTKRCLDSRWKETPGTRAGSAVFSAHQSCGRDSAVGAPQAPRP